MEFENGIYGILGANGAGKSTLLKIIAQCSDASDGKVTWNGTDVSELGREYRKVIGYVPQQQAMYDFFRVQEYLEYIALLKGIDENISEEIDHVLRKTGLEERGRDRIRKLSGGMKQRLLISQALLGNPSVLIMDEPTVGLDLVQREEIRQVIKGIAKGRIVLITSHIFSDVEQLADEVVFLKEGRAVMRKALSEMIQVSDGDMNKYHTITLEKYYLTNYVD